MSNDAVRVSSVGKRYQIGGAREAYPTLRDTLVSVVTGPIARLRHPGSYSHHIDWFWALRDVSFEMKTGEVLGIIGRNGAGKSTLLKVLSRITEPTEGRVELWGRVGSLLEVGTGFHPELTGRDNVWLNGAILGMRRAEIQRRFDEIVEFAGISRFLDTPVKRYSSGMYVRLAFAVAAHLDPDILVVDEVLSVGDAEFQKKCLAKMGETSRSGRTVLFVSHNMAAVRSLCSRAIVLEEGKQTFDGSPMQAVAHYLRGQSANRAQRVWDDVRRAPGGDGVACRSVAVRDAHGEVTADIDVQEPFSLEVDFEIHEDGQRAGLTLVMFNDQGTMLFSTLNNRDPDWHGRALARGTYRSICRIPDNLLNGGDHSVSVLVWTDGYRVLAREDDVVHFHVHDTGGARGDYMGGMEGALRPALQWQTEKLIR
jgi:lipopolysaccharide transport system ATP-binding protein